MTMILNWFYDTPFSFVGLFVIYWFFMTYQCLSARQKSKSKASRIDLWKWYLNSLIFGIVADIIFFLYVVVNGAG